MLPTIVLLAAAVVQFCTGEYVWAFILLALAGVVAHLSSNR